jgi:hypothetical protein
MSRWKYLNLVKFLVPTSLVIGGFGFTGCATGPLFENPAVVRPELETTSENPVYVPLGPASYGVVFEKCMDVVDDFF